MALAARCVLLGSFYAHPLRYSSAAPSPLSSACVYDRSRMLWFLCTPFLPPIRSQRFVLAFAKIYVTLRELDSMASL